MELRWLFLLSYWLLNVPVFAQTEIDWFILADAKFSRVLVKQYNSVYLIPKFGKQLKAYDGEEVILAGYTIPLTADFSQLVLSKSPYASCFFCGQAGPETVVELELKPKATKRRYRMDEYVRFKGVLRLNRKDPRYLCYKLTEAEVYGK